MVKQLGVNVILAFVWAFLGTSFTAVDFLAGFVLGAILIGLFNKTMGINYFYLDRFVKLLKLLMVFLYELVVACFQVLFLVLSPKPNLKPGIIRMEVNLPTDFQTALLASLINLTPGTMNVEVSRDKKTFYIHALNINDAGALINSIRRTFEDNIREVWR